MRQRRREPRSLSVRIGCDRYGERFSRSHIRHHSHLVVENLHKILLRKEAAEITGVHIREDESHLWLIIVLFGLIISPHLIDRITNTGK